MKRLYFGFSLLLLTGCATRFHSFWSVRELVVSPVPVVDLTTADIIEVRLAATTSARLCLGSRLYRQPRDMTPWAAVRLHEKMLTLPGGVSIPFLSGHPSGQERIKNLRQLIETKNCKSKATPRHRNNFERSPFE